MNLNTQEEGKGNEIQMKQIRAWQTSKHMMRKPK